MNESQKQNELFQGLILSLAAGVMQHLGKTLNPMTQKIEKNLPAAQSTIDMLDMLEAKTKGNLDEAEGKLLTHVLSELKMNYVETLNEKPAEVEADADKPAEAEAPKEPAAAPEPEAEATPEQAD
jgi:Domain of unknown function (DUF1844)